MVSINLQSSVLRADTLRDITKENGAPPSIAALFLIHFDLRKGYTVTWKQAIPDVELDNLVEFKSLPSGLHNVREDLIYFVHGNHAGQSAFINVPDDSEHRNARMLAVGVLVPLKRGRLGKAWMHAPALKDLASQISEEPDNVQLLERYWKQHQLRTKQVESPPESPLDVFFSDAPPRHDQRRRRQRQSSSACGLEQEQARTQQQQQQQRSPAPSELGNSLAPLHPALSLPEFLDRFGPLVFPLYRLALLRKRILLVGDAPVQSACNYVYDISLLSTLPDTLLPRLPASAATRLRPRPLFTVGVHDLPYLTDLSRQHAQAAAPSAESQWIANTSDKILAMKNDLYDVIVELPPDHTLHAPGGKVYPKIRTLQHAATTAAAPTAATRAAAAAEQGSTVKATKRDARRWTNLRRGLRRQQRAVSRVDTRVSTTNDIRHDTDLDLDADADADADAFAADVVEPQSWVALACSSLLWWASAGAKDGGGYGYEYECGRESEDDARLLYLAAGGGRGYADLDEDEYEYDEGDEGEGEDRYANANAHVSEGGHDGYAAATTDENEGTGGIRRRPPGGYNYTRPIMHQQPWEITLIAYFRTLTARIFTVLADAIERSDSEDMMNGENMNVPDDGGYAVSTTTYSDSEVRNTPTSSEADDEPLLGAGERDGGRVVVTSADVERMGLDASSAFDREFVRGLVEVWWGREAEVRGDGIRCCGWRIL